MKIIEEFNAASAPVEVLPQKFGASLTNIKAVIAADTAPDTYFIAWREGADVFLTGAVADLDAELKGDKEWGDLHNLVVSKNKDAAKQRAGLALAKYMNRPVNQAKLCTILGTAIPVSRSALQLKEMVEYGKQDAQWRACLEEAPNGDRAPTLPSIVKMVAVLDTAVADVMAEKTAVASALDGAQREMQLLLDADLG